ncbi:NADH-quinone oxidoreductase subunit C, partial [Streptomyces sp. NPDC005438]|uniref:NADH-quinone oxidoreductase subunit C n=1 Tax=Streptomyces sp. NPDC005438 TaxID=3156880 RepID=UPI0033B1A285
MSEEPEANGPTAPVGWLPQDAETLFGEGATAEEAYRLLTVDVPPEHWIEALTTARDQLECRYFDWLSAVDEPDAGFRICAHLAALPVPGRPLRRLLLRTTVDHATPVLPTATGVFAGATWHERETHEMFGVDFTDHPGLEPLLLPETFEGHPLRKDFVLAARVAKAWPGAKEPGESDHGGPKRRQMLPPGVPDPNEWGPLKGQLPPAPARPARGRAGAARAEGERPTRRARSASGGSASQHGESPERPARRTRTASGGSASQRSEEAASATRETSGTEPSGEQASKPASTPGPAGTPAEGTTAPAAPSPPTAPRSSDAPWHHAEPATGEGHTEKAGEAEQPGPTTRRGTAGEAPATPERTPTPADPTGPTGAVTSTGEPARTDSPGPSAGSAPSEGGPREDASTTGGAPAEPAPEGEPAGTAPGKPEA